MRRCIIERIAIPRVGIPSAPPLAEDGGERPEAARLEAFESAFSLPAAAAAMECRS